MTKRLWFRFRPRFGDVTAAAEFSGYSRRTIEDWVRDGKIKTYKPAGKKLIDLDELTAFITASPVDPKTKIDGIVDEVMAEFGK